MSFRTAATALALLLGFCARALAQDAPLDKAYAFLDNVMDRYSQGADLRLVQSFVPTPTFDDGDTSYTYDDDVMIIAFLQRGQVDDGARAKILGDSLLYAQTHDPLAEGRIRNAYHANPFLKHSGSVSIASGGSDSGNLAWTGMALMKLHHATRDTAYLKGAISIATLVEANAYDTRGRGGFTGGFTANQSKILWKSTEHNLDLYALFTMLSKVTRDPRWKADAAHALNFIKGMWNKKAGHFYIGTTDDGKTVNTDDPTPEDVQTWSFLSTGLASHQKSIDWALANLSATSGDFQGLSFDVRDRSGVWFEGTAHAAAALLTRNQTGDADKAAQLLNDIENGQTNAPNGDGRGIDAASKDGLQTDGSGDAYYASLHTGATGWYCIARQAGNPFVLGARRP